MQRAESVEAMDRRGQIAFCGESQLPAEHLDLFIERRSTKACKSRVVRARAIQHPTIEPDFADGSSGRFVEVTQQCPLPFRRAVADIPRMDAKARKEMNVRGIAGGTLSDARG